MPSRLTCSKGHQWELPTEAHNATQVHCPVCGDPAEPTAPSGVSWSETPLPQTSVHDPLRTPLGRSRASADEASPYPAVPGYEILGELGRGGMGVVYLARQVQLERLVALKMILAGRHASAAQLERFKTEAESIARLRHPNIVAVYEVGEHEGKPFFSLEFCEGGSLHRALAGNPLPAEQAAHLTETLARAMHAAHRAQVIHRDLKPANVLLVGQAFQPDSSVGQAFQPDSGQDVRLESLTYTPKITDFGLAKKLDEAGQTHTGDIMGTPSYMAPEQAEGMKDVGPAVDVYALGAILYECLTGRPPFKAATTFDTLQQVVSQEPVPPRQLNARVPADLQTICLSCLRKDPRRRYTSAEALADDLRRFLDGKPILARPVGPLVRLGKWVRRRPAIASLLAALAVVTALGIGLVLWEWREAEARKAEAEASELAALASQKEEAAARVLAERKKREADLRYRQARDAVDQMLTRVGDKRLADIPQAEQVRRELLAEALRFYQGFLAEKSDDPELRLETAHAYRRVGFIEGLLGKHDRAESAYLQAISLFGNPAAAEQRQVLAGVYAALGALQAERGQLAQAEKYTRLALDMRKRLADDFPARARYRRDLAESYNDLGSRLHEQHREDKAEEYQRLALRTWQDLTADYPTKLQPLAGLARSRYNLANLLHTMGRYREAEESYRLAVGLYDKLMQDEPPNETYRWTLARAHGQLGSLEKAAPLAAEKSYRRALQLQQGLVNDFPAVPRYRRDLGVTMYNLWLHLRHHKSPEAEELYRPMIGLMQKVVADAPAVPGYRWMLSICYFSQGNWLKSRNQHADAEKSYRQALELQEALVAKSPGNADYHHALARTLNNLAQTVPVLVGRSPAGLEEARRLVERAIVEQRLALKIRPKHPPYLVDLQIHLYTLADLLGQAQDHTRLARAAEEYAEVFSDRWAGHYEAGRFLATCLMLGEQDRKVPAEKRQALGRDYASRAAAQFRQVVRLAPNNLWSWYYLALMEARLGETEAYQRTCADLLKRFGKTTNVDNGHWIARACLLSGGAATPQVVELAERAVGATPTYFCLAWSGAALYRTDRAPLALKRLEEASKVHKAAGAGHDLFLLAMVHHRLNHPKEATQYLEKGIRWLDQMQQGKLEDNVIGKEFAFNQWVEVCLLRAEAEGLIKGKAAGK